MKVSIIIPAYNAAETIAETLTSVISQTFSCWEAIVVDDGSFDTTESIATEFAKRDDRIRVLSQPRGGVCTARNAGIALARYDWLLFLDSDDLIAPEHLESLTALLSTDSSVDGAYCGWSHIDCLGKIFGEWHGICSPEDLFERFTQGCLFHICTCIVRKSLVEEVGKFDISLRTCEDWDLWQRIARRGARFVSLRKVLAYYRTRPGSLSSDGLRLLEDGFRVITRGHAPDPRVRHPVPRFKDGIAPEQLSRAKLIFACWVGGRLAAQGEDPLTVLEDFERLAPLPLSPDEISACIGEGLLLFIEYGAERWSEVYPAIFQKLTPFLAAFERKAEHPGVARRMAISLEKWILLRSAIPCPFTMTYSHSVSLEVTDPIPSALAVPSGIDRLNCRITLEGAQLGVLELPVFEGFVSGYVIVDALASEFAWQILGRFFENTLYADVGVYSGAHDQLRWAVFLQQLWDRPDWEPERFYDYAAADGAGARVAPSDELVTIEASEGLPDLIISGAEVRVLFTVGGAAVCAVNIPSQKGLVKAQALRAALNRESGIELCTVAVREGLIGVPLKDGNLRVLLAMRARKRKTLSNAASNQAFRAAADETLSWGDGITFGRRKPDCANTSVSRRATLPLSVLPELLQCAESSGEPVYHSDIQNPKPKYILYAPDIVTPVILKKVTHSGGRKRTFWKRLSLNLRRTLDRSMKEEPSPPPTEKLPILLYHRIAPIGAAEGVGTYVTPRMFEEQLKYLRDRGFYSITLEDWRDARERKRPLFGRAIMLTFDHGYRDFLTYTWPLLRKFDFSAMVFLVTDLIGLSNRRDGHSGENNLLLDWKEISKLRDDGVVFASQGCSHRRLASLPAEEALKEAVKSRAVLMRRLGSPVNAIAYPYGSEDPIVHHLVGASGYVYGLSRRPGLNNFSDPLLSLPRIEVVGSDTLSDFVAKLE